MRTRKAFAWTILGALTAFVVLVLVPHLRAAAPSPSGVADEVTPSTVSQEKDESGLPAGVAPAGTAASTVERSVEQEPVAEKVDGDSSGLVAGQTAQADSPSDPAAAGVASR